MAKHRFIVKNNENIHCPRFISTPKTVKKIKKKKQLKNQNT